MPNCVFTFVQETGQIEKKSPSKKKQDMLQQSKMFKAGGVLYLYNGSYDSEKAE